MNVLGYVEFVVFATGLAYAVKWIDSAALAHLARQTGLSSRKAWSVTITAFLWMFLPVLAGAESGDGKLWIAGSAFAGAGFFLVVIAVSSRDEHELLQRATHREPNAVTVGTSDKLVATSDIPDPVPDSDDDDQPAAPFSTIPSVHTDWIVQQRRKMGIRKVWQNIAEGVQTTAFTIGKGAVEVTPGRHRVFSNVEKQFMIEPSDDVPDSVAAFLADHPDLPDPDAMEKPIRVIETIIPAEEPVTIVGTPTQAAEPGTVRIDNAPADVLLGTHTDHAANDGNGSETVLIHGSLDDAERLMKKRVYWLGTAGLATILGGQIVAFWLSDAVLTAFL